MTDEKQNTPPCVDCAHCKIIAMNSVSAIYLCRNSYVIDDITGIKAYRCCEKERGGQSCVFKPAFCYRLKRFFSKCKE